MSDTETKKFKNEFFKEYFFVEKIDAQKLNAIISCDEAVLHVKKWWQDQGFTTEYGDTISNEKEHLQNILDSLKKNKKNGDFEMTVQYFSRGKYGRVYAKNAMSLGMLRREIRHYLCDGIYYDIDMVNAHSTIAVGLCKKWDIECPAIIDYVKKRRTKIKDYKAYFNIERADVKTMFCSMLNGGSWRSFIKKKKDTDYIIEESESTEYLDSYMADCKHICDEFSKKVPKSMYEEITKNKSLKRAKKRTFIAVFLQIYEEKILRLLYGLFEEMNLINMGYAKCVLCHDGAMIQKSIFDSKRIDIHDFIMELNDLVEEEMGFRCDFKLKDFDEKNAMEEILKNHIEKRKAEGKEFIDPNGEYIDPWVAKYGIWKSDIVEATDTDLANLYFKNNKSQFVQCHKKLYKKNICGLFQRTENEGLRQDYCKHLKEFIDFETKKSSSLVDFSKVLHEKFFVKNDDDEDKKEKYISVSKCSIIKEQLAACILIIKKNKNSLLHTLKNNKGLKDITATLVSMYNDDDFAEKLDIDPKLLGFNNGIIDLDSGNIFEVRNAQEGEYVSMSCGYDFYVDDIVKKNAEIIYKLINEMFESEKVSKYVLKEIAKCLKGGGNIEERANFWLGGGGNGKGLLMAFIEYVLGDYFYPLSYKIFTHIKEDNRSVELYEARKKRYCSVSEPAKKFQFNSDTFKLWTGRDPVNCRNNYDTKMTKYVAPPTTLQANHHIQFDGDTSGHSTIRRIAAVDFIYSFMKESEYDKNNPLHKRRDNTWKDKCKEDKYKRAFMYLLLQHYEDYKINGNPMPELVKKYSKEYTKYISADKEWFNNNLVKDDVNGKNIGVKNLLNEFREDTKNTWKMKHFCDKLEEYGYVLANGRAYSLCGEYQVGGNSTKYVKNVRFTGREDDDSDNEDISEQIHADIMKKKEEKMENVKIEPKSSDHPMAVMFSKKETKIEEEKSPVKIEPKSSDHPITLEEWHSTLETKSMFRKKETKIEEEKSPDFWFWKNRNRHLVPKLKLMWRNNSKFISETSDSWTLQDQYFENIKEGIFMEYQ